MSTSPTSTPIFACLPSPPLLLDSHSKDLADDEDLVELQLNCVAVFVGNRPPEDSLNTAMLQAAQEVDINHYYKELPHFVSVRRHGLLETHLDLIRPGWECL